MPDLWLFGRAFGAIFLQDAMADVGEPQKRRRIRGKTSVGNLSVRAPADEAAAAVSAADDEGWSEAFLVDEDLSFEIASSKKAIFLVTLPHPRPALPGQPGLCQPGALTHEQVTRSMLDSFAKPEYVDPGARARGGPSVRVERMVVFKEKHAPGDDGVAHVHYHVAPQQKHVPRLPPKMGVRFCAQASACDTRRPQSR